MHLKNLLFLSILVLPLQAMEPKDEPNHGKVHRHSGSDLVVNVSATPAQTDVRITIDDISHHDPMPATLPDPLPIPEEEQKKSLKGIFITAAAGVLGTLGSAGITAAIMQKKCNN